MSLVKGLEELPPLEEPATPRRRKRGKGMDPTGVDEDSQTLFGNASIDDHVAAADLIGEGSLGSLGIQIWNT